MKVSNTVFVAGFAISFAVNVVLGVLVGYMWKRLSKSVTVDLCFYRLLLLLLETCFQKKTQSF